MILDRYGRPLVSYERRALGFVDRTLPESGGPVTGVVPPSGVKVRPEFPIHDAEEPYGRKQ